MIIELPLYNKILILFINFIAIWLAIIVYNNNRKGKLNKIFLGMIVSMFLWVNFAYLARLIGQQTSDLGLIFLKIAWSASPFLFISLYFLVVFYLNKEKRYLILNKIIFLSGLIVSLITISTNLVVKEIEFVGIDLTIIYGKEMFPFLGIIFLFMCAPLYLLLKEYIKCAPKKKIKIEYLLVGIFIFYLANIIFGIIFPIFLKIVHLYWIGDYSAIFLLIFTAYAIVKHKLFGIKVVLTSIFVSLIAILLLLDILFLTPELLPQLYKGLLLIIFIYFGYLLIKSVVEEIKRREEMEILSRQLKKANLKLEKLVEMREEFLHITSHQLRTPLTAIRGMISMWHDGDFKNLPQEEKNKIKNRIYISAERLNNITNNMINAMELEGKHFDFKFKPVSLEKIISDAVNTLKINYDAKGLFLNFEKPKKAFPKIQAEPEYLSQVFLNLINNAEKYTENGGTTISISQKAKNLIVEITDTGIGISEKGQKALFRKFSRGQRAKKVNATGSGLGLYIAKQIVEAHHGEIKVKSAGANKGSIFTVILPIKQPEE